MPEIEIGAADQADIAVAPEGIDWWTMLADPEYLADPHPELRRIRALGPVHLDPVSGIRFVLGHEEFRHMATAPQLGRDTRLWREGWSSAKNRACDPRGHALFSAFQPQMTNADPPDHRRMRGVYEKAFRRDALARFAPAMAAECDRLLDALPREVPVDFMPAFAEPFAQAATRVVFDLPREMDGEIARWVAALSLIGNILMTPQQKEEAAAALAEFRAYLEIRLASPAGRVGFLGLAHAALSAGTMDADESLNNLVTLISGGTAIATLLGNGLLTLLRHPGELARLRADPGLLPTAIEEMLRYEPGGMFILRVAREDYAFDGARMPAGSIAIALVAAINRDPARFADPDRFDIARKPNPHYIFGGGPHICLGKEMVRIAAQVAFSALVARFGRIELAGAPVWWTHRSDQHGLHSLPLRLGEGT